MNIANAGVSNPFDDPEFIDALEHYIDNPVDWVYDYTGYILDPWQIEAFEGLFQKGFLSVRSGHGVGKTKWIALAVVYFLGTRYQSRVLCTSPSKEQLFDALWPYLNELIRDCPMLNAMFTWTKDKVYVKSDPGSWFAVARTAEIKKSANALTAATVSGLQGKHADHILVIVDEAAGVEEAVFNTIDGAMTTENSFYAMTGNPTHTSGRFYDSHNSNSDMYHTIHVNSEDSPRVTKKFINMMLKLYHSDREHPMYRARVRGEFPNSQPNALYPLDKIEQAMNAHFLPDSNPIIRIGADIARYGSNNTVFCISEEGTVITPYTNEKKRGIKIRDFESFRHLSTMESAGRLVMIARNLNPIRIAIDEPGVGGGVFDRMRELGFRNIVAYNGGRTAKRPKEFVNVRCETNWQLHNMLMDNKIVLPKTEGGIRFKAQATPMVYIVTSAGKIKIQSKEELLSLGFKSPDDVDAAVLAVGDTSPCEPPRTRPSRFRVIPFMAR